MAATSDARRQDRQPAGEDRHRIRASVKPEVVWDEYFAKNDPQPAAVREAVRRLMNQQKFDQVIALIGAALRHRQGQPWMYEALALAMEAAGRPKAEIERAVMSAVDFADNTGRPDVHRRLPVAARARPACLADLPASRRARSRSARALHARSAGGPGDRRPRRTEVGQPRHSRPGLARRSRPTSGRPAWAWPRKCSIGCEPRSGPRKPTHFEAALNEAVAARLRGHRHLDRRRRHRPAGRRAQRHGLLAAQSANHGRRRFLGDESARPDATAYGGHSQVYVCPKGFDGTYRMLVRRVWGNVTAGKVNVEVLTHCNTPNAIDVRKRIPLEQGRGRRWRSI